jgi:hypothetical protein
LRRRHADRDFIQRLPPRLRVALIYYIETGDLWRAQWISWLDLDHFRDLMRQARIHVVLGRRMRCLALDANLGGR